MSEIVPKQRARHVQGSCRPRDVPRRAAATLGGQRAVNHESRQTRSFRFLGQGSRGKKAASYRDTTVPRRAVNKY